jgi:hypothetical protein
MQMKRRAGIPTTEQLVQNVQDVRLAQGTGDVPYKRGCRSFALYLSLPISCVKPLCWHARRAEIGNTYLRLREQMRGFTTQL